MSELSTHIYKVSFVNQNKVYEVYARKVLQSEMMGFVELEDFVFDEQSGVLVDPAEEKLKTEFSGVSASLIPLHHIIRIDVVETHGTSKIRSLDDVEDNVRMFPDSKTFGKNR